MKNFKFKNKAILIISPESWGEHYVSKHHYATVLSKNNQVFFLNPPSNEFSLYKVEKNLSIVDYEAKFKGLRFLPNRLNRFLVKKEIQVLECQLGVVLDVIWNFDPSRFFNLSLLKNKLRICHIVDLNQDFQRKTLANTSDISFVASQYIKEVLGKSNQSVHKINHGYQIHNESYNSDFRFPGKNKLKAILVGNLSRPNIDWEILKQVAIKNELVDFIYIGPIEGSNLGNGIERKNIVGDLASLPNVYFTGAIKSLEIPSILKKSDILLVSFKEEYHIDQANPHKIMEYLGSGKVIVATKTDEYEPLAKKALIAMSDKNNDFPELFDDVVANITDWNANNKLKARIGFAENNSYDMQVKRIEILINELNELR